MAKTILKLTYQHSKNLACFVSIYKSILLVIKKLRGQAGHYDTFFAGLIGGYIMFGSDNPVNNQIVLYLFSRISTGMARLAVKKGLVPSPEYSFSAFAAVTWGIFD